jgi:hypothetical protein
VTYEQRDESSGGITAMTDHEFDLIDPPFFNLEEILRWIEFTQVSDGQSSEWSSMLASIELLDNKLRNGLLKAYASIDTSLMQAVDQWAWIEFEILPAHPNGTIIQKKGQTDVFDFVVRSFKAYRAAALKDLSQPSDERVPGSAEPERGYHRVMDQVVFREEDVRRVFPTDNAPTQTESLNDYAEALREIENGKYFRSPAPLSQADIGRLIFDHWKAQKAKRGTLLSAIQRSVSRHYKKVRKHGQ